MEPAVRSDPEAVIEGLYAALRLADVEATLAYCADHMVYVVHVPSGRSISGGEIAGKGAIRSYLNAVVAAWEFLLIEPGPMQVEGGVVREVTSFRARLRARGDVLDSQKRHVWLVENGHVTRCEEFQDAKLMEAFLGLSEKA